jgi:hypothetical protein
MRKELPTLPGFFDDVDPHDSRLKRNPSSTYPDSIFKMTHQLACLSPKPVYWGKKNRPVLKKIPEWVGIGPSVFRQFVCVDGCHACCAIAVTLDFLPEEFAEMEESKKKLVPWEEREIIVNGKASTIVSVNQSPYPFCPYLTAERPNGGKGCSLWPKQPLECASAPQVTFMHYAGGGSEGDPHTMIMKKPFGRGWNFPTKMQCEFHDVDHASTVKALKSDLQLLIRYNHWAEYLGIETVLPKLIGQFTNYITYDREFPTTTLYVWRRS